jgi:hypothetical protein
MPHARYSPEFKLLLRCHEAPASRVKLDSQIQILATQFDENIFKSLLVRHRVAPIVYLNLKNHPSISPVLKDWLKSMTEQNQLISLKSLHMMLNIQRELNNQNFEGVFLKGVPLAEMYYGDTALRESIDIDLWVEEKAIVPMSTWLKSLGYVSNLNIENINKHQLQYIKRTDYHHALIATKPELSSKIELHWKIRGSLGGFNLDPSNQDTNLITWFYGGLDLKVFDHVDQFLYLCTHGTEHAWFRLKWLFDLPQLIAKINFDWCVVRERAKVLGCLEHLEISFLVLKEILNIDIPLPILEHIVPGKYKYHLKYILQAIRSDRGFNENDRNRSRHFLFLWSLSKKRLNPNLFLKYLTGPGDWKYFPLPENLFFLYFPLRPFLWISRRLSHSLKFMLIK